MHPYHGSTGILATKHHKEKILGPIFAQELNMHLVVPKDFDSDVFGTFTGEIERPFSQEITAYKKAEAALKDSAHSIAVSSEGSYNPHPFLSNATVHTEIVALVDAARGLQIKGTHTAVIETPLVQSVSNNKELRQTLRRLKAHNHSAIVRAQDANGLTIIKDLSLEQIADNSRQYFTRFGTFWLEEDLRFHKNPKRSPAIKKAAHDLIDKIRQVCPNCGQPGFVSQRASGNYPCALCQRPTSLPALKHLYCGACRHTDIKPFEHFTISASYCDHCNP